MTEVMPVQIDFPELLAVPEHAFAASPRLKAVSQQPQRVPGRLDVCLILAALGPEDERVGTKLRAPSEDGGKSSSGSNGMRPEG